MQQLELKTSLYSNSSHVLYISMTKKEALALAQNLIQQVNCDVKEVDIMMTAREK